VASPPGVNHAGANDVRPAMLRPMADHRWDGDERGDGVADASQFVGGAAELIAAMQRPNWVAEEPEMHLLPHLRTACESLPFRILDARTLDDGSYEVQLGWTGDQAGVGRIRASIFSLLGAEPSSYVSQRRMELSERSAVALWFDVVTGIVDEVPFTPHGHTLRLTVTTMP
jgi:hypothetical protein